MEVDSQIEALARDRELTIETSMRQSSWSRKSILLTAATCVVLSLGVYRYLVDIGQADHFRLWLADHITQVIVWVGLPCLIVCKIHVLPKKINQIAILGLIGCFILVIVRLTLLAFGD